MSKLLQEMRHKIRFKHYSIRTEQAYLRWAKDYILFHKKRHPAEMGKGEVSRYLSLIVDSKARAARSASLCRAAGYSECGHAGGRGGPARIQWNLERAGNLPSKEAEE